MLFGEKDYIVYLLSNTNNINRTYLGITKNLSKTIKEHNGELKGGPEYTKFHKENGEWFCAVEIKNLTKNEAITIERLSKYKRRGNNSQNSLEKRLNVIKPLLKYYPDSEIIEFKS